MGEAEEFDRSEVSAGEAYTHEAVRTDLGRNGTGRATRAVLIQGWGRMRVSPYRALPDLRSQWGLLENRRCLWDTAKVIRPARALRRLVVL
jgi:hypothetical protein